MAWLGLARPAAPTPHRLGPPRTRLGPPRTRLGPVRPTPSHPIPPRTAPPRTGSVRHAPHRPARIGSDWRSGVRGLGWVEFVEFVEFVDLGGGWFVVGVGTWAAAA
nr:hypothetical protein GCM10020092_105170 [Actinoplanes digitatis]